MDVQVKLWLQGGHIWEFCCDEDDPIIFGLVSALPGADLGGNLPADGLIQVETRSGERLYIARSSIVSVDILPSLTSCNSWTQGGWPLRHRAQMRAC